MARVTYGMMMSLDGYIAGPEGRPVLPAPGRELYWHFNSIMKRTAVALYGRRMYEVMRVWEDWDKKADAPEVEVDFARAWQETPKLCFRRRSRKSAPTPGW